MIQYGDKFKLMDIDGTFVGFYEFLENIDDSDRFYYRDENGVLLVSEEGQWISKYSPTEELNYKKEIKNEDVMISIEKTINDAFKQFGVQFGELLEEKMNEMKEEIAQVIKNGNRNAQEHDLEILNEQFVP